MDSVGVTCRALIPSPRSALERACKGHPPLWATPSFFSFGGILVPALKSTNIFSNPSLELDLPACCVTTSSSGARPFAFDRTFCRGAILSFQHDAVGGVRDMYTRCAKQCRLPLALDFPPQLCDAVNLSHPSRSAKTWVIFTPKPRKRGRATGMVECYSVLRDIRLISTA